MISLKKKFCKKCSQFKGYPQFHKQRGNKDGRRSTCKSCTCISQKKNYKANSKARISYQAGYTAKNREKVAKYQHQYDAEHKEDKASYDKEYREKNKDSIKSKKQEYYLKNVTSIREKGRQYYLDNIDKYYNWSRTRQMLKKEAIVPGEVIPTKKILRERDGDLCYLCGILMEFKSFPREQKRPPNHAHLEHIIPLSHGGKHTLQNTSLSCASCNWAKGEMTPEEWLGEDFVPFSAR